MSETLSETRDVNTCLVGSGLVRSGPVRVRLVEFGLKAQIPLDGPDQTLSETQVYDQVSDKVWSGPRNGI